MRRKNHGYQVKKKERRKFIQGKKEFKKYLVACMAVQKLPTGCLGNDLKGQIIFFNVILIISQKQ